MIKKSNNARLIQLTTYPQIGSLLASKQYDDESISNNLDKLSLLRLNSNENIE